MNRSSSDAKLNVLRIFLRLTKDTKLLDLKKCLLLQEIVDEIGRMLGGWMKSVRENKNSPSPGSLRERVVEVARRNCRAADDHTLSLGLSSQLLLTFTRPLLTVSSARPPCGSAYCPFPSERTGSRGLLPCGLYPLSSEFYSGATPHDDANAPEFKLEFADAVFLL